MTRNYKASTAVGCNGFRIEVPLDLSKKTRGDVVESLEKVAECGRWPQQACTTMFFFILHLDSLEWLGALEVSRWQQRHRVGWDAPDVRNGGAERIMWETLVEMEGFDHRAGETEPRAITLVFDLAQAFKHASFPVVWAWATQFKFSMKIMRVLCGYFQHTSRVQFEGCVAEPLQNITARLLGSK